MDNNKNNNKINEEDYENNVYLTIGKKMHENIYVWNDISDNIIIKKKYDDYKNEYINKLNKQIKILEEDLNKINIEIEELERKNLELFIHITKDIHFKYQKRIYFGSKNILFNKSNIFNINKSNKSLDSEKYKMNQITINQLNIDRDIMNSSLDKIKSYKMKYET